MSSAGPNPTPTNQQPSHSDRLLSKRKLEDPDSTTLPTRIRKNSSPNCTGKSVLENAESSGGTTGSTSSPLQFFVRMISGGKTLILRANLEDTIEMVHEKIYKITGLPVIEQGLIYRGKQLQWENTLEQCGIQNDAGLQLVGRMRSTDHPRAWQVITDLVSLICRLFRKELPIVEPENVKLKLEQYVSLLRKKYYAPPLLYKYNRSVSSITNNGGEDEGDLGEVDCRSMDRRTISKCDYCRIFLDACAPQSFVMLYLSKEKSIQDCADDCVRSFVDSVKDMAGSVSERVCSALTVMELCRLLRTMVAEDDLLYKYCRSNLGAMLGKVGVKRWNDGVRVRGYPRRELDGISVGDLFPFVKEVGQRLVKELNLSAGSATSTGPLLQDVRDFEAFLKPVLSIIEKEPDLAKKSAKAKEEADPLANEFHSLFNLSDDLISWIDKCLKKMDHCFGVKNEKGVEVYPSGCSQYLAILKELHIISRHRQESNGEFSTTMRQNKTAICRLIVKYAIRSHDNTWLLEHKDVLDFGSRRHLALLLFPEVIEDYDELHEMLIDRSNLLAESLEYITLAKPSTLHSGLFMEFKNEEATGPGVLREWFCLVCQAIFDLKNGLFVSCPMDRRRFFPSPASKVHPLYLRYFQFAGRVIALALMYKIQVGVVLDRAFVQQLAGRRVSIEDIRDADPSIFSSCKQIMEMDAEFVDSDGLGLTFSIEVEELGTMMVVELRDGGKFISVNSDNREEYVDLIIQHHFVSSISEQVACFIQGFTDILSDGNLRETFFEILELGDLDCMLHGSESEICVKDWSSHTDYNDYKKSDPLIVWFWEVVGQLTAEQKRTLLFFWTSVKYLPIEGFRGLASRLSIYKSLEPQYHLPSSHTCFYRLCIPQYPSKAILRERLLVITQEHIGCSFGTW